MDLYALPPERFTAARDEAVKAARAAGDKDRAKEIAALRRPTAAAHAVNTLVREAPDVLAQLLDLGAALADAQRQGRGADLTALGAQRRQLVEAVADRALELAGTGAREEVTGTLEAALADPASAEAVRTGRLVRSLSYAGFGGVDLSGAVADPAAGTAEDAKGKATKSHVDKEVRGKTPTTKATRADAKATKAEAKAAKAQQKADRQAAAERAEEVTAAEQRAQQAHGELDDAVRQHEEARSAAEQAKATEARAKRALHDAEQALTEARKHLQQATAGQREAASRTGRAATAVTTAQGAAERARKDLDALRRA